MTYIWRIKKPSRKVNELDNRGSHFYLAMYWARALAEQTDDARLQRQFEPIADQLEEMEEKIVAELNGVQGSPVDLEGYYKPNEKRVSEAMRPSETFNAILAQVNRN